MMHVVFAVPFAMENTLRFVRAAAALPGVRLSVVSQDGPDRLPADVRAEFPFENQVREGSFLMGGPF